eukprot:g12547.t1
METMMIRLIGLFALLLLLAPLAQAELKVANVFSDHMVLQQKRVLNIWGWAKPGDKVTVTFITEDGNGLPRRAVAGDDGKWLAQFPPITADGKPMTLRVSSGDQTIEFKDVYLGEVWICSGQSNMNWPVERSANPEQVAAGADHPTIRLLPVTQHQTPKGPVKEVKTQGWQVCSPETIPKFSAVAYHFGHALSEELGVPIGLIRTAWGGTRIEPWTPPAGFAQVERFKEIAEKLNAGEIVKKGSRPQDAASCIYNGMVAGLTPLSVRGVIWYQGESNGADGLRYESLKEALVKGWREVFQNEALSFYWVQLANFNREHTGKPEGGGWGPLREAQRKALRIPNTGMAVAIDIGNTKDIHPKNKQDVGRRLARWALAKDYGKDIVYSGPLYQSHEIKGNKVIVRFDHADGGLSAGTKGGPFHMDPVKFDPDAELTGFALRDDQGNWHWARAIVRGDAVVVASEAVKQPTAPLLDQEWLLTNGAGGFGMGTCLGVNTRRYHGLLVAASQPPVGRVVVLNQLFEQLELQRDGVAQTLEFGGCLFLDGGKPIFAPDSTPMLKRFDRGLDVVWSYQWGGLTLTRRLVLHDGEPSCTVHYDLTGLGAVCSSATLRVRPMITLRDFHQLECEDSDRFVTDATGQTLRVARGGLKACYHAPGSVAQAENSWWYNVHQLVEAQRGMDCFEDLFVPGQLAIDLGSRDDASASFTATLGDKPVEPTASAGQRATRLQPIVQTLEQGLGLAETGASGGAKQGALSAVLAQAGDDFIVKREVGGKTLSTIIAGYPWFADWGRDTFIALPGLMLCTGRHDEARDTLEAFAKAIKGGLVPNRFDDNDPGKAHYNTVDGSMWYIHSALEFVEASGDDEAWSGWLAQACVKIVEAYRTGMHAMAHDGQTPIPIAMDDDGLIAAGDRQSQLTWMDAACWGPDGQFHVFTPRPGKCVEINGLWHSALVRLSRTLPDTFTDERKRYADLAEQVKTSFAQAFWSETLGHFVDHLAPTAEGWVADPSLRPNQLIACALAHGPVEASHRRRAVEACRERLLTPVGPRTLPIDDAAFHDRYLGGPFERDGAYHRGTVWPWLIGPYCESVLRVGEFSDTAKLEVQDTLAPLIDRLVGTGLPGALGSLSEIHEPVSPYAPRGCPAQAWSVAEVLRMLALLK